MVPYEYDKKGKALEASLATKQVSEHQKVAKQLGVPAAVRPGSSMFESQAQSVKPATSWNGDQEHESKLVGKGEATQASTQASKMTSVMASKLAPVLGSEQATVVASKQASIIVKTSLFDNDHKAAQLAAELASKQAAELASKQSTEMASVQSSVAVTATSEKQTSKQASVLASVQASVVASKQASAVKQANAAS